MWRYYVYIHRREDSGAVFYVGKGAVRQRCKRQNYERATNQSSRNNHWHSVVKKHGLAVEVIASFETDAGSQLFEKELIARYGRDSLVNMTDGGDGHAGLVVSDEVRLKRSLGASRKRSDAWVSSIRKARKNGGNGGVVKRGDKLPESWVKNLAAAKVGAKNPYFGKPTAVSKHVMNVFTGHVYDSISRAAKAEGMKAGKLYSILDGHTKTNTIELVRI